MGIRRFGRRKIFQSHSIVHPKATESCLEMDLFGFIISLEVKSIMETKDIILELRNKAGLSQDELAEKVFVTRQAVSR